MLTDDVAPDRVSAAARAALRRLDSAAKK